MLMMIKNTEIESFLWLIMQNVKLKFNEHRLTVIIGKWQKGKNIGLNSKLAVKF